MQNRQWNANSSESNNVPTLATVNGRTLISESPMNNPSTTYLKYFLKYLTWSPKAFPEGL